MAKTLAAIPAYNEEVAIGGVVLKAREYVDEVLVVDDGSQDDTSRVGSRPGKGWRSQDVYNLVGGGIARGPRLSEWTSHDRLLNAHSRPPASARGKSKSLTAA